MPDPATHRLATLPSLNKPTLSKLWKELFNSSPPPKLRRDLMVHIVGYRLQEQAFGSLSSRSRMRLSELAKAYRDNCNLTLRQTPTIKPGTRLVRQWQSETYVVHVEERGYEYKGSHYSSLSEIARFITGTRRSGPLFFGVKDERRNNSKEAA
jgi:hypothetical protein